MVKNLKVIIFISVVLTGIFSNVSARSLHEAVLVADKDRVVQLIAGGADVNAKDEIGNTPLHYTMIFTKKDKKRLIKEIFDFLLASGADVNVQNNQGVTPLFYAVMFSKSEMIERLINLGADVNIGTEEGYTPLHVTCSFEPLEVTPQKKTRRRLSKARTYAYTIGAITVIALVTGPAGLGLLPTGLSAYFAIESIQKVKIVKLLLAAGANPNAQGKDGNTPLHFLAGSTATDLDKKRKVGRQFARKLLIAGADPKLKNKKEQTPYDVARKYNRRLAPLLDPKQTEYHDRLKKLWPQKKKEWKALGSTVSEETAAKDNNHP